MEISNTQGEAFYHLSKKERRELKKQEKIERKERKVKNGKIVKIAIAVFVIALVGFIGWWGVTKSREQTTVASQATTGSMAPNFTLPSATGKKISLSDYKGKSNVLIYFNEGLSCDPCIQQIPELERYLSDFQKMNVVLLSVMYDQPDKLKGALEQYHITTPLLSYFSANTENDYDLTPYSMAMGRRAGHTFILVDTKGKIIWRKDYWPGYGMSVNNGLMFVKGQEIVNNVTSVLKK